MNMTWVGRGKMGLIFWARNWFAEFLFDLSDRERPNRKSGRRQQQEEDQKQGNGTEMETPPDGAD
jgi:hypothetical protein